MEPIVLDKTLQNNLASIYVTYIYVILLFVQWIVFYMFRVLFHFRDSMDWVLRNTLKNKDSLNKFDLGFI